MGSLFGELSFNMDNGYLEGLVRGFRSGILNRTDYLNLIQCDTLEGELIKSIPSLYEKTKDNMKASYQKLLHFCLLLS